MPKIPPPGSEPGEQPVPADPAAVREWIAALNGLSLQALVSVEDLELLLAEARDDLDPETVRVIEENLRIIDDAIAASRQALERDPANEFVSRHLAAERCRLRRSPPPESSLAPVRELIASKVC